MSWKNLRYALLAVLPAVALALPASAADEDDKNTEQDQAAEQSGSLPAPEADAATSDADKSQPSEADADAPALDGDSALPNENAADRARDRANQNSSPTRRQSNYRGNAEDADDNAEDTPNPNAADRARERSNRNNAQNNRNNNRSNDTDDEAADRARERRDSDRNRNSANRDRDDRSSDRTRENRERSRDSDRDRDSADRDRETRDADRNRDRDSDRSDRDSDRDQERRRFSRTPDSASGSRDITSLGVNVNVDNDRLVVNDVRQDSVFSQWGIQQGDVIVSVGGRPVNTRADFTRYLFVRNVPRIPVVVLRDGTRETIYVVTREIYVDDRDHGPAHGGAWLGVTFSRSREDGALVRSVTRGSPADRAGLQRDDLIVELDGQNVRDERDVIDAVGSMNPGDRVDIVYFRGRNDETAEVVLGDKHDRVQVQERTTFFRGDDGTNPRLDPREANPAPQNLDRSDNRGRVDLDADGDRDRRAPVRNTLRGGLRN